jgi:hypothetical protein
MLCSQFRSLHRHCRRAPERDGPPLPERGAGAVPSVKRDSPEGYSQPVLGLASTANGAIGHLRIRSSLLSRWSVSPRRRRQRQGDLHGGLHALGWNAGPRAKELANAVKAVSHRQLASLCVPNRRLMRST